MKAAISSLIILLFALAAVWFFTARPSGAPPVSTLQTASGPVQGAATDGSQSAHLADAPGVTASPATAITAPSFVVPPATGAAPSSLSARSAPSSPSDAPEVPAVPSAPSRVPQGPPAGAAATPAEAWAAAEIEYEIPAGMRAPAVFLPEDRPLTPPMQRFLDDVRREFDAAIAAAEDPATVWEAARRRADDRYRLLFGDDAFNQKTMQDAIEALRSKGALPNPPAAAPTPVVPAP